MSKAAWTAVTIVALAIGCREAPETGAIGTSGQAPKELTAGGLNERTAGGLDGKIQDVLDQTLDADPVFTERDVNFEVHNAMVAIKGSVRTADEKNRVGRIAKAAPGVKDVANELEISPE